MNRIEAIVRIDLVAFAPDPLARFYVEALGFAAHAVPAPPGEARRIELSLGQERIALAQPLRPGRPCPPVLPGWDPAFQHFAIVVADMGQAMRRLQTQSGWSPISAAPQRLPASSGSVTAFKFRDPEGHPLELLQFPIRSAPLRWRRASAAAVCLGIDHSAISVSDANVSIKFYETLGLSLKGRGLNQGEEQALLDGVRDPHVDVIDLRAEVDTPHLELLCYRGVWPRTSDRTAENDGAATKLVLSTRQRPEPGVLRDPDGHWLRLGSAC